MMSVMLLMTFFLFFNVLPINAIHSAPLEIEISAKDSKDSSTAYASGADVHTITHDERTAFDLHDDKLKECVGRYFGATPDDAWLHEPTGDLSLYNSYEWSEVKTELLPVSAEVISTNSKPFYYGNRFFDNRDSSGETTYTVSLTGSVTNSVENSWSESHTVSVGQSVNIGVEVEGLSAGMEQSFEVSNEFGKSATEVHMTTISSTDSVEATLAGGEVRHTAIAVNQVEMSVKVEYRAHLRGSIAVNYGGKHKNHHFWGLDINRVMGACGLPTTRTIEHTMHVRAYSRGSLKSSSTPLVRMVLGADGALTSSGNITTEA